MVAYNFNKRFVPAILSGIKTHTIRGHRKNGHVREGDTIQLYTAMRTKYCQLVGTATCLSVMPISIHERMVTYGQFILTDRADLDHFAKSDGFKDWSDMRAFWDEHHGNPNFTGMMVLWTSFFPARKPFLKNRVRGDEQFPAKSKGDVAKWPTPGP